MKCCIYVYYYLNVYYLVFDSCPCIHAQLDLYPSCAHELSTVSVHMNLVSMRQVY